MVGSMCHGSGLAHKSINDYIRSVEYVDANGAAQTITDPSELHAALGCFGLLGIITHVTYEVKKNDFRCHAASQSKDNARHPAP